MTTGTGEVGNRLPLVWVAVAITCLFFGAGSTAQFVSTSVLSHLKHGTGWILLGFVSETGRWETEPSFKNVSGPEHKPPSLGERIRLTGPHSLYILGYGKERDETRVYEVPAPRGVVNDEDQTGLEIPSGTELKVEAVAKGPGDGSKWAVWARVVSVSE